MTLGAGSSVTTWADQTGNYPLSQSEFVYQPILVPNDNNGEPALRFGGSQSLANPASLGVGISHDMTMIAVSTTALQANPGYQIYLGNGSTGQTRAIGYQSSEEYFDAAGHTATGVAAPNINTFISEAASLNSALTTVTLYQNGAQTATGTLTGLSTPTAGISVGNMADAEQAAGRFPVRTFRITGIEPSYQTQNPSSRIDQAVAFNNSRYRPFGRAIAGREDWPANADGQKNAGICVYCTGGDPLEAGALRGPSWNAAWHVCGA